MKTKLFSLSILAAVFCLCCSFESISNASSAEPLLGGPPPGGPACSPLKKPNNEPLDPVTIQGLNINGDCLEISVSYAGGCENHDFGLTWDGSILKSLPPQANLPLSHDSNGDMCEALISETISFRIKKLQAVANPTVIINVIAPDGSKTSIPYTP